MLCCCGIPQQQQLPLCYTGTAVYMHMHGTGIYIYIRTVYIFMYMVYTYGITYRTGTGTYVPYTGSATCCSKLQVQWYVVRGGGVAQLVVVPLAMGRGAKSPGFDSHQGLSFQKGREDGWIGLNPPPGVHGSSPSYASGRLTV